jgi:plastocyanin
MSAILLGACAPTDKAADTTEPPGNSAPTISGTPSTSVAAGTAYTFTPMAADVDAGTTLVFSITNKPGWAAFSTSTGALTGTPASGDAGTTNGIVISVSDNVLSASLPAFDLTVTTTSPTNHAPTISGTPSTSVVAGNAYTFTPAAADIDTGTTLVFSITNKPSWATFSTSTGKLSGTPAAGNAGTTNGIVISVSDSVLSASLPAFNLTVTTTAPTNHAPTISGTPATSVTVGNSYSFTPTAADVDAGTTLVFSITNKPSWATFSTSTGRLSGTPTNANIGTTSGVRISVSDGSLSAQLPLFNLAVVAAPTTGSATLTWVAPTVNSDGTPLSDLAGYVIRYGTSSTTYSSNVRVTDPSLQTYTVQNLASGTYFFAVAAFDTSDNTSTNSNQVTKTIP